MNAQLNAILNTSLPTARNCNMRQLTRKEWATEVRNLLKSLNIKGVSVTTPNYSQASTISIRLPDIGEVDETEHAKIHDDLWRTQRPGKDCPHCGQRWNARYHLEEIILAAFPDLNDRSILREDYYDYCLSFS